MRAAPLSVASIVGSLVEAMALAHFLQVPSIDKTLGAILGKRFHWKMMPPAAADTESAANCTFGHSGDGGDDSSPDSTSAPTRNEATLFLDSFLITLMQCDSLRPNVMSLHGVFACRFHYAISPE